MKLSEIPLSIKMLDIGASDAEADYRLEDCFIDTPFAENVLSLRNTIVVGRKGAGKSALFRKVPDLLKAKRGENLIVLSITPDQYSWATLKAYEEQGIPSELAHTNAWKLTIAMEAAVAVISDPQPVYDSKSKDAIDTLKRFIKENYGDIPPSLESTVQRLVGGLKNISVEALGIKISAEKEKQPEFLSPLVIRSLLSLLKIILKEKSIVILLDKLDDSWDGHPESRALLIGLLKAAKEFNDEFQLDRKSTGLAIICFIRTDIYDSLKFDDKDKHRTREINIAWTQELLHKLVQARLPPNVKVREIFEVGDMRGSIQPFNYMVKRTFLRPREIMQFIEECKKTSSSKDFEIKKDHIRTAENTYSNWKVSDVKQEYEKAIPDIADLMECLRQGTNRYDSFDEFESKLRTQNPKLIEKLGIRKSMEILYECSIIGVRLSNAGSPRYKCEDVNTVLPNNGAIYIHQGLHAGLNIVEKRGANGVNENATDNFQI